MIDLNTFMNNRVKTATRMNYTELMDEFRNLTRKSEMDKIVGKVSDETGIPIEQMKLKKRNREIVQSRQLAMKMLRKHTRYSLAAIGKYFETPGHVFDHATVLHSLKTVSDLNASDKYYKMRHDFIDAEVEKIRQS
jgi:chromosomal replication initiator protein